jgi:hypothetical protein
MSQGVSDLTNKVNQLHSAIASVGSAASSTFSNVGAAIGAGTGQKGLGVGGNTNVMYGALAQFSTPAPSAMPSMAATTPGVVGGEPQGAAGGTGGTGTGLGLAGFSGGGGVGKGTMAMAALSIGTDLVTAPVKAAFASMIDTNTIVNRAGGYFQAATMSGNSISRAKLENATFSALQGQITSMGSDAATANILANAGFNAGSQNYLNVVSQVAGAARTLAMPNENAANAMSALATGGMGANLYQYGISTIDSKGNALSVGNIAQQAYSVLFPNGNTAAGINSDFQNGNLGPAMQSMGFTGDLGIMMRKAFQDIANGKNPDLASAQNATGNNNPYSPLYQMNSSQTGVAGKSESAAIQGLQTAADTVTAFNKAFGDTIASLEGYKAYLDGLSGTNAGKGAKSLFGSILGIGKKILGVGMMAAGALTSEVGIGVPIAAAGAAMTFGGGGSPGYGGSFSGRARGGGTPGATNALAPTDTTGLSNALASGGTAVGTVSANYGDIDSSIWSKTGGKHLGTDFIADIGTTVVAAKDGIVSNQTLNPDYGDAVIINHPDGYSTIYAHLSRKDVSPGTQVSQGQKIGETGKSGNTTGPGLHFEVQQGPNNPVDPSKLQGAILPISGQTAFDPMNTNALTAAAGLQTLGIYQNSGSNGAVNPNAGTAGDQEFARAFLTKAGIKVTDSDVTALTTWMHWEGGTSNNAFNPLNTTLDMPGAGVFNSVGVKTYGSLDQGVDATLQTLTGANADARGYTKIMNDLRSNASLEQFTADVNSSKWGTKIKGGGTPGSGASMPDTQTVIDTVSTVPTVTSSGSTSIGNTTNIYLTVSQASDSEAILFAKRVKALIDDSSSSDMIGRK